MILEEPVTQIYSQINLVRLRNIVHVLVLVHVDRHKLIADFWRMFRGVYEAKLFCADLLFKVRLLIQLNLL